MAKEKKELPELEQVRNEKCIPIARAVLADLATDLLKDGGDPRNLTLKILRRSLDTDMNIATEVSYVPQLVLGVLAGLNRTVQECDPNPLNEERYNEIARKILTIVSEANIRMGEILPEESIVDFAPVKEKLNALFTEEKLSRLDVKYIMERIFEGFTVVNNQFSESVTQSSAKAEAKLFGIPEMSDLTMKRLNEVLISDVQNPDQGKI